MNGVPDTPGAGRGTAADRGVGIFLDRVYVLLS